MKTKQAESLNQSVFNEKGMVISMDVYYFGIDEPHKKGKFCPRHVFDFYTVLQFSTDFAYDTPEGRKYGRSGEVLIMPPKSLVHHGPASASESFMNDWMYVDGIAALLEKYPVPIGEPFNVGNKKIVCYALKKIGDELSEKKTGYRDKIDMALSEMVIDLYRSYDAESKENSIDHKLCKVKEEITKNPEKQWTLEEMARLAGYSASHFSSLYTGKFGMSPKAELMNARLDMAKLQLRFSNKSINDISRACGFQSLYYFSKYFKARAGVSPKKFRNEES